jgi:uncharacterized protein YaiE (UPF0345 family)
MNYQTSLNNKQKFPSSVVKKQTMIKVNEYFEGTVKSLAYTSAEGRSTIGVIESGEYEFGTSSQETMIVIEGELVALLPGENEWKSFTNGQSFEVPADSSFKVKTSAQSSYLCKYR